LIKRNEKKFKGLEQNILNRSASFAETARSENNFSFFKIIQNPKTKNMWCVSDDVISPEKNVFFISKKKYGESRERRGAGLESI
jgi:hypothetical protein